MNHPGFVGAVQKPKIRTPRLNVYHASQAGRRGNHPTSEPSSGRVFMQPFTDLGVLVEGRWRDENYDEDLFPDIAAGALREADLTARIDPWEIIRWVHTLSLIHI